MNARAKGVLSFLMGAATGALILGAIRAQVNELDRDLSARLEIRFEGVDKAVNMAQDHVLDRSQHS